MRRRTLLRSVPALAVVGTAGCSALGASARPELDMKTGSGVLLPATDSVLADGLDPGGTDRVFVTATADEAPDVVGPDAPDGIESTLRNRNLDAFHVVVQLRSSPAGPTSLWPARRDPFDWPERWRLRATVSVEPWGSIDRIDDEDLRETLRSAEELVFTGVWTLSPAVDDLPETVELELATEN